MTTCAELRAMAECYDRGVELSKLIDKTTSLIFYVAKKGETQWSNYIEKKLELIFPRFIEDFITKMRVLFPDIEVSVDDNRITFDWSTDRSVLGKRKERD